MARPWIVGSNPAEPIGSSVSDGYAGRVSDPLTGAGVFNPNLDPAVVGIDPLTGSLAPSGTDMSFGSAIRRQMHTNVINGDFAVLPPGGADSLIDSDPASATYNPLPGWTWVPDADGLTTATVTADAAYASGYKLSIVTSTGTAGGSYLQQLIPVPMSQGQQYRVLVSMYGSDNVKFKTQFLKADLTAIGSEITCDTFASPAEVKMDAGLVPPTAAYIRFRAGYQTAVTTKEIGEVRCAFSPAEASLGLGSLAANTVSISTSETQIKGITIPANTLVEGSTYRLTVYGSATNTSGSTQTTTFRLRCGPTSLSGTVVTSRAPLMAIGASNDGWKVEFLFSVRTVGASGSAIGNGTTEGGPSQPWNTNFFVSATIAAVTIDTTVANVLELTAETANANAAVVGRLALIECVMAS